MRIEGLIERQGLLSVTHLFDRVWATRAEVSQDYTEFAPFSLTQRSHAVLVVHGRSGSLSVHSVRLREKVNFFRAKSSQLRAKRRRKIGNRNTRRLFRTGN